MHRALPQSLTFLPVSKKKFIKSLRQLRNPVVPLHLGHQGVLSNLTTKSKEERISDTKNNKGEYGEDHLALIPPHLISYSPQRV